MAGDYSSVAWEALDSSSGVTDAPDQAMVLVSFVVCFLCRCIPFASSDRWETSMGRMANLLSYGCNLGRSSFISHCASCKGQSRNRSLKFIGITRLGEIDLRPGHQCLPHVRFESHA